MPNWSYNIISVKGEKSQVINWLNMGLSNTQNEVRLSTNMSAEEMQEVLKKLEFPLSLDSFNPMPDTFKEWDTTNSMETYYSWLSKTWNMIPKYSPQLDSQKVYKEVKDYLTANNNTDNSSENMDSAAKDLYPEYIPDYKKYCAEWEAAKEYQQKEYGVVGWYDWGCKYRGTKWNSELKVDMYEWEDDGDNLIVHFTCETAWSLPSEWLIKMQKDWEDKGLNFFCRAQEEGGLYNCYGQAYNVFEEDINTFEKAKERVIESGEFENEDSDEYYDALYEIQNELDADLNVEYLGFVRCYN